MYPGLWYTCMHMQYFPTVFTITCNTMYILKQKVSSPYLYLSVICNNSVSVLSHMVVDFFFYFNYFFLCFQNFNHINGLFHVYLMRGEGL